MAKQWEYHLAGAPAVLSANEIEEKMNELGGDGWENYHVQPMPVAEGGVTFVHYFKREKSPIVFPEAGGPLGLVGRVNGRPR